MMCPNCETLTAEAEQRLDRMLDLAAKLVRTMEDLQIRRAALERIMQLADLELDWDIQARRLAEIRQIAENQLKLP